MSLKCAARTSDRGSDGLVEYLHPYANKFPDQLSEWSVSLVTLAARTNLALFQSGCFRSPVTQHNYSFNRFLEFGATMEVGVSTSLHLPFHRRVIWKPTDPLPHELGAVAKGNQDSGGNLLAKLIGIATLGHPHGLQQPLRCLRVRPETLCRITEFSEHESNGRELDEGERVAVEVLPVLGQSAAAVEPGDGAFDHPTPGLDDEALHPIGSLDDLGLEIGQDAGQGAVKDRPLIGAVGEQFPEKGKQTEQGRQQRETAVAILNVGGGDDAVQQQALRIDQNMPLLALDQLAGIEAVAVDASPPFSALFTL